jgi:hypothetical protein
MADGAPPRPAYSGGMDGQARETIARQTADTAVVAQAAPTRAWPHRATPAGDGANEEGLALFRRALEHGDQAAWETIVRRYRGLVLDWVRRITNARIPREQEDDWVTRAFERFWLAVGRQGNRFRDLAAALQYLKLCVRSVVLDEARARQSAAAEPIDGVDERHFATHGVLGAGSGLTTDAETVVLGRFAARDLWRAVLEALPDEDERIVANLSFVQGLKPGEIAAVHPQRFASVADVYRVKRNAIDRLRRCPSVLTWLQHSAAGAGHAAGNAPLAIAPGERRTEARSLAYAAA